MNSKKQSFLMVFLIAASILGSSFFSVALAQKIDQDVPKTSAWYPKGSPQGTNGDLWNKGTSGKKLTEKMRPKGHTEQHLEGPHDGAQVAEEDEGLSLQLANGAIKGDAVEEGSQWQSPGVNAIKIDEEVLSEKRNIVGAYAPLVQEDGLNISVGPELHIPDDVDSPLQKNSSQNQSEVGMGMRLMWDF